MQQEVISIVQGSWRIESTLTSHEHEIADLRARIIVLEKLTLSFSRRIADLESKDEQRKEKKKEKNQRRNKASK